MFVYYVPPGEGRRKRHRVPPQGARGPLQGARGPLQERGVRNAGRAPRLEAVQEGHRRRRAALPRRHGLHPAHRCGQAGQHPGAPADAGRKRADPPRNPLSAPGRRLGGDAHLWHGLDLPRHGAHLRGRGAPASGVRPRAQRGGGGGRRDDRSGASTGSCPSVARCSRAPQPRPHARRGEAEQGGGGGGGGGRGGSRGPCEEERERRKQEDEGTRRTRRRVDGTHGSVVAKRPPVQAAQPVRQGGRAAATGQAQGVRPSRWWAGRCWPWRWTRRALPRRALSSDAPIPVYDDADAMQSLKAIRERIAHLL